MTIQPNLPQVAYHLEILKNQGIRNDQGINLSITCGRLIRSHPPRGQNLPRVYSNSHKETKKGVSMTSSNKPCATRGRLTAEGCFL